MAEYESISYDEGVRLIVELRKRSQYETGQIIAAIHGPDPRPTEWWERLAEDTGYKVRTLRDYHALYGSARNPAAESKHLPRARHAIAQLEPEQKVEAVLELMADPEVASQVLSDHAMQTKLRRHLTEPRDPQTLERIRQAELAARERELAEQDAMDRILGSTEILRDLVACRDRIDEFVTRWSNRRIRLADEEKAVYDSEVAAGRRGWDQIERLGEGRDSLEDELQRLAEEQQR